MRVCVCACVRVSVWILQRTSAKVWHPSICWRSTSALAGFDEDEFVSELVSVLLDFDCEDALLVCIVTVKFSKVSPVSIQSYRTAPTLGHWRLRICANSSGFYSDDHLARPLSIHPNLQKKTYQIPKKWVGGEHLARPLSINPDLFLCVRVHSKALCTYTYTCSHKYTYSHK